MTLIHTRDYCGENNSLRLRCSDLDEYEYFGGIPCLHLQDRSTYCEDMVNLYKQIAWNIVTQMDMRQFLQYVGIHLADFTVSLPRIPESEQSQSGKPRN
jgi:hypothetical protein